MTYAATATLAEPTAERVLRAAYACFDCKGIARTTIEDISREAGISRPTLYKYFAGKEAILDEISRRETFAVNAEVRRNLVRHEEFADFLTGVLLLVVRTASRNPYIRRVTESRDYQLHSMERESPMFRLQREWWHGMLRHAAEREELATDLDEEEIVTWLTYAQSLLLNYIENPSLNDAALIRMIRRFVVEPLLARPQEVRG